MSSTADILIISPDACLPPALHQALDELHLETQLCRVEEALGHLNSPLTPRMAVLALQDHSELQNQYISELINVLTRLSCRLLVLGSDELITQLKQLNLHERIIAVHLSESADMIKARIATLQDMQQQIDHLTHEIQKLRTLGQPINSYMSQVDEEMRLAARLQKDFLPRKLPHLPGVQFATIYRPASWVSGDIYDICRLDEHHLGFYIADAVGHGMPAALLTIFIKRAIVTKEIQGHDYTLIEPGQVLARLNQDMVGQNLSDHQFATCCYGILNTQSLELRLASAGHPAPMLIDSRGRAAELDAHGTLLGVLADQHYQTWTHQLSRGDKLILFSDGVEVAFINDGPDKPLRFRQEFTDLGHRDIQAMCHQLVEIIDREEGSLHPRDDVTIVGIELS